jgi:teichuronic acid exporter
MSLKKTAVSGMIWTFTQQFGGQALGFLVSIFIVRLLDPAEFGLIGMISIFMAVATTLVNSGLTQSLIRTKNPDQDDYSTVFYFNMAMSIGLYIILFFSAPLIADFYKQPILTNIVRLYCVIFVINAFSAVQLTRLTKEMNFKTQVIVALPSIIFSGIVGIILAYYEFGVWALVWMEISKSLFNSIQLWIYSGWKPSSSFNKEKFKFHITFGSRLAISGLLDTIFVNIYQILIGRFFTPVQVGYYTRADVLKQLPVSNVTTALNRVTYPLFASIQDDDVRLKRVYKQIMQMVIFLISPVLVFMGVLAEPLIEFLFTEKWLPMVPYFQILCVTGILHPIHSYNLSILTIKGRSDLFLKLEIYKKILVVIIIAISIQYGIIMLIWGQVAASFIAFFINSYYTGKFINYTAWQQLRDILPMMLLAAGVGGGIYLSDMYFESISVMNIFRLIIGSGVGVVLYLFLSYLLKFNAYYDLKGLILKK